MEKLKCRKIILIAGIIFAVLALDIQASDWDVYLVGGQSNANGRADSSQLTGILATPQNDVEFYYHKTQTASNTVALQDQFIPLQPGSGHGTYGTVYPNEFGPEVSFGRTLADAKSDRNIMVIKYSHGGTNLYSQWASGGSRYNTFVSTVNIATGKVTGRGDTFKMMGMIWVQGEADQKSPHDVNYGSNLSDLISRVRTDLFDGLSAPFAFSSLSANQTNYNQNAGSSFHKVRAGQIWVNDNVDNTALVNTDDASFSVRADGVHFDAPGQVALGQALANAILSLEEPGVLGDLDGDGDLDLDDWLTLKPLFYADLSSYSQAERTAMGDFNTDSLIDEMDFDYFKLAYNQANGPDSFEGLKVSIPEPATLMMIGVGVLFKRKKINVVQGVK